MIRYQTKRPKLLFVGINPHPGSDSRGVPFSNNKLFWYLLAEAGLLKEKREDLKSDEALQEVYRKRFNRVYGLGLINVIDRPTRDVTMLTRGEEAPGQARIRRIIKRERPPVVCFVGKIAYQKFSGLKVFGFGWQPDIFSSRAYVMHFPLHGKASVRVRELKLLKRVAQL